MSDLTDMHNERLIQVNAELRAEVERLQAELRVAYQLPSAVEHAADAELRADNERLLGACKDKSMLLADAYTQNERLLAVVARADNLRRRWLNDGHELREPAKNDFRSAVEAYDEARRDAIERQK